MSTRIETDRIEPGGGGAGGIELHSVSKRYGDAGAPLVVAAVSLRVARHRHAGCRARARRPSDRSPTSQRISATASDISAISTVQ